MKNLLIMSNFSLSNKLMFSKLVCYRGVYMVKGKPVLVVIRLLDNESRTANTKSGFYRLENNPNLGLVKCLLFFISNVQTNSKMLKWLGTKVRKDTGVQTRRMNLHSGHLTDSGQSSKSESFEEQFDKVLTENKKLKTDLEERDRENKDLTDEKKQLQVENQLVRESSDNITKKMAKTLENQNIFEDVSNPLSCRKLTERFKAIYDKEFFNVSMALEEIYSDEIEVIQHLTKLMMVIYESCCKRADEQMRQFLLLDDEEAIPSRQELTRARSVRAQDFICSKCVRIRLQRPALYRIRCDVSAKGRQKDKVVKGIINKIWPDKGSSEIIHNSGKEDIILNFLSEFTDCAWLMTIADTQLDLNFNVVDCSYTGITARQFTSYATSVEVLGPVNTIKAVVWPSVTSQNGQDLYAKGDVLVTTTKAETKEKLCEKNGENESGSPTEDGDKSCFLNQNAEGTGENESGSPTEDGDKSCFLNQNAEGTEL